MSAIQELRLLCFFVDRYQHRGFYCFRRAIINKKDFWGLSMGKKILGYFLVTLLFSIIGAIILTPSAPKGAKSMASDPYLDGGEWNISFSNGMSFEDATCIMWNQNRDESEWVLKDGTHIIQDGETILVVPATNNGGSK